MCPAPCRSVWGADMNIKQRLADYLKLPGEDPIGDPLARDALAEIERLEGRVAHCERERKACNECNQRMADLGEDFG